MPDEHLHAFGCLNGGAVHAPTHDGGHTAFLVLVCACGAVDVFPRGNFALLPDAERASFLAAIRESGRFLVGAPS